MTLAGLRAVIVIAEGYHDHEFWYPYYRLQEEGMEVVVAGPRVGEVLGEGRHGKDGLPARITHAVTEVLDVPFDLLYLPGGIYGPLRLRNHAPTLELTRRTLERGAVVAAICHAPWILVSAGVLKGHRVACPSNIADDVRNAGGQYVTDTCVADGNLVTAVNFAYLPQHFQALLPELRKRAELRRALPPGAEARNRARMQSSP